MTADNNQFYTQLPVSKLPLASLLTRDDLFHHIPDDWHVVVTDIRNSTLAVQRGQHQNVNLIATGSIVSVLNIALNANVSVPFFFGGDGATFILPPCIISKAMQALSIYRENTLRNFELELRTGTVPVKQVYNDGLQLHIARHRISKNFSIPVVLGNGLNYAERLIKGEDHLLAGNKADDNVLDLTGMQCRWDRIAPPEDREEVVTLLVVARNSGKQGPAFSKVMQYMEEVYGPPAKRQPISVSKLRFNTTFSKIEAEMRAKLGRVKVLELFKNWLVNLYGLIFFRSERGKHYLEKLVEMSDTLVIDGRINTVISGTAKQRAALQHYLDEQEAAGEIIYGLHVSGASIMSCYVRDLEDGHIHFVDGSEGGYTEAAKMLKRKV